MKSSIRPEIHPVTTIPHPLLWCRRHKKALTITADTIAAVLAVHLLATPVRGYSAWGAEIVIPFFVPIMWATLWGDGHED